MKAHTNSNNLPLGITLGDPAGIGPELAIKIMSDQRNPSSKPMVFIGNLWALNETARILGAELPSLNLIDRVEDSVIGFNLIEPKTVTKPDAFRLGKVQASCGQAAMDAAMDDSPRRNTKEYFEAYGSVFAEEKEDREKMEEDREREKEGSGGGEEAGQKKIRQSPY